MLETKAGSSPEQHERLAPTRASLHLFVSECIDVHSTYKNSFKQNINWQ